MQSRIMNPHEIQALEKVTTEVSDALRQWFSDDEELATALENNYPGDAHSLAATIAHLIYRKKQEQVRWVKCANEYPPIDVPVLLKQKGHIWEVKIEKTTLNGKPIYMAHVRVQPTVSTRDGRPVMNTSQPTALVVMGGDEWFPLPQEGEAL